MNEIKDYTADLEKLIKTKNINELSLIFNNDAPLFSKQDYEYEKFEGNPKYFEPDDQNRATGSIALVSKNTIPLVMKKKLKYPNPYGWNKNLENRDVFERCHIIAYSLSAKFADKKNIFIGTKTLNKSIMAKVEKKVKKYIQKNNVRVLYRVTVKYKGNEQIPRGILIEAQSLDDDFSICRFCYNVQKNVDFDYKNGSIIKDNRIARKIRESAKKIFNILKKNEIKTGDEQTMNYIINRKTKVFHLKDNNCNSFRTTPLKYINETTAKEKDLIKAGLNACKKCNNK